MQKSDRTRAAILSTAQKFFWNQPFRDLTVGELMARAGLSRSAFYQYFNDLHDMMRVMLDGLRDEILTAAGPWFTGEGDPIPLLHESLEGLVKVCYKQGPFLKAIADASTSDETLEKAWKAFLKVFDDAVAARIEYHQSLGLIPPFPAFPMAVAFNRMDAYLFIHGFGQRPRADRDATLQTIKRVWLLTLYGRMDSE